MATVTNRNARFIWKAFEEHPELLADNNMVFPDNWDDWKSDSAYVGQCNHVLNLVVASNGKVYPSKKQAAQELGIPETMLKSLHKDQFKKTINTNGEPVAFVNVDKHDIIIGAYYRWYLDYNGKVDVMGIQARLDRQNRFQEILKTLSELINN